MKQQIILISGFGGTGKTTIAQLLFDKLGDCALVQADHLFLIKPWAIGEKLGRIKLRNCLDVMQNFVDEGYQNIICEGLVWSQPELDAVRVKFAPDRFDLFLFWLTATKSVRYDRVVKRAEPGDTEEFLEHVEEIICDPWPLSASVGYVEQIDTTASTPETVTTLVIERLFSG